MHSTLVSTLAVALLASTSMALPQLAERAATTNSACAASNTCYAALAKQTASAKTDCSSFLRTTVTPCAKTVKSTITVTSTIGCPAPQISAASPTSSACPVTQTPNALPSYAAGSCDAAGYSAACGGCLSAKTAKTTLPQQTVTATTYTTVKATPTFSMKVLNTFYKGAVINGGNYPHIDNNGGQPDLYTMNSTGTLFNSDRTEALMNAVGAGCYGCYYPSYLTDNLSSQYIMSCKLGSGLKPEGYLSLTCATPQGAKHFQQCSPDGNSLDFGGVPDSSLHDCTELQMGAYPVCG